MHRGTKDSISSTPQERTLSDNWDKNAGRELPQIETLGTRNTTVLLSFNACQGLLKINIFFRRFENSTNRTAPYGWPIDRASCQKHEEGNLDDDNTEEHAQGVDRGAERDARHTHFAKRCAEGDDDGQDDRGLNGRVLNENFVNPLHELLYFYDALTDYSRICGVQR